MSNEFHTLVPASVRAHLDSAVRHLRFGDRLRVLLSGPGSSIGHIVLLFLAIAWALGGARAWADYWTFAAAELGRTTGVIVSADSQSFRINKSWVSELDFTYEVGEQTHTGTVYSTSRSPSPDTKVESSTC